MTEALLRLTIRWAVFLAPKELWPWLRAYPAFAVNMTQPRHCCSPLLSSLGD